MAKTIMISNEIYKELKVLKEEKSFSELLKELLETRGAKRGSELKKCLGILKKDKEWKKTENDIKKGWKNWTEKYV